MSLVRKSEPDQALLRPYVSQSQRERSRGRVRSMDSRVRPARQRGEHPLTSLALVLALILMVGGLWFMVPA